MKTRITAAVLLAVAGLLVLPGGRPASAHGATTGPISRTAACAAGGERTGSAVCRAALRANGGPFGSFDNLRVAGVDGRDAERIPDGRLCSGGVAGFAGLDLARADWPATEVTPGTTLTLRYRTTIPHRGTFRVYLTEPGYRPDRPLGWDDLAAKPIGTATDPPMRDGAYRFTARLPAGRTGRHLLYVVWRNSTTPDTYYSCSDVVFPAAKVKRAPAAAETPAAPRPRTVSPRPPAGTATSRPPARTAASRPPARTESAEPQPSLAVVGNVGSSDTGGSGGFVLPGALIALAVLAGGWAALRSRRRR